MIRGGAMTSGGAGTASGPRPSSGDVLHDRSPLAVSAEHRAAPPGHRCRILLTGMSAVGKSTLVGLLRHRGYAAVDTDEGYTTESLGQPGEVLWLEDRVAELLAGPHDVLFVAGCARNQVRFHDDFNQIVLLSAPPTVIRQRLRDRDTNPFGKTAEQEATVLSDQAEIEPLLRQVADHEIVTTGSVTQVLEELLAVVAP